MSRAQHPASHSKERCFRISRILWFNWRDVRNPEAGGAEIYTHNIAKRLVKRGFEVTLFTSSFHGGKEEEIIDGVRIIRRGGRLSVYKKAEEFCRHEAEDFNLIVDEVNTRPFMTVKLVNRRKILMLIHQLAREFWFYETPLPVALVGYFFLENWWLKKYRGVTTITVSKSTRNDLLALGFRDVKIIPNGVNVDPLDTIPEKEDQPTIVFVGRMKRAKKPEDVIKSFLLLRRKTKDLQLWMVGDGYLRRRLEEKYGNIVSFFGHLTSDLKNDLVKRAWVIAVPGVREGWGQVVTDSNALGTPAVGYDIPGLRDSIKHGYNGLLVRRKPEAMADGIGKILSNEDLRIEMSRNALKWARKFNWDKSAEMFEKVVLEVMES